MANLSLTSNRHKMQIRMVLGLREKVGFGPLGQQILQAIVVATYE